MRIVLHQRAFFELQEWAKTDTKIVRKIFELLADIDKHPYSGLGKPEPLKHKLKGLWSRRITEEHRLVYAIEGADLAVISCKTHYV